MTTQRAYVVSPASSSLAHASDIDTTRLSEDVASLLRWGRGVLQLQREGRRLPPSPSASTFYTEAQRTGPVQDHASGVHDRQAAPSPRTGSSPPIEAAVSPAPAQVVPRHRAVSSPSLHTLHSVHELEERLAQITALEAANAAAFAQRMALLQRGRDRLLRQSQPAALTQHERRVADVMRRVQAVVEGEEVLCDALRDVAGRLAQYVMQQQQQQQYSLTTTASRADTDEDPREAKEINTQEERLEGLVRIIKERTDEPIRTHAQRERRRAEERARTQIKRRQRADALEQLKAQLKAATDAVQRFTEVAEQREAAVAELQARQAAAEKAAALRRATARRRQALHDELRRLNELHEHATLRGAVEREETAACEAKCREAQAVYDMALHERDSAEDELRDARAAHRKAEDEEAAAAAAVSELRRALSSVEQRSAELRAHRLACEEDTEALERVARRSVEDGAHAARNTTERRVALQRETAVLAETRRRLKEEAAALQEGQEGLQRRLRKTRAAVALLQAQKAALEAHLVSQQPARLTAVGNNTK